MSVQGVGSRIEDHGTIEERQDVMRLFNAGDIVKAKRAAPFSFPIFVKVK